MNLRRAHHQQFVAVFTEGSGPGQGVFKVFHGMMVFDFVEKIPLLSRIDVWNHFKQEQCYLDVVVDKV